MFQQQVGEPLRLIELNISTGIFDFFQTRARQYFSESFGITQRKKAVPGAPRDKRRTIETS